MSEPFSTDRLTRWTRRLLASPELSERDAATLAQDIADAVAHIDVQRLREQSPIARLLELAEQLAAEDAEQEGGAP